MNAPFVSVIIPAHNAAVTLVETLDSIIRQRCPVEEIIVIDDQSTDETVRVFNSWCQANRGCIDARLLQQTRNTGPAGARNAGIREAKGQWIGFLDADDAWLEGKLEAQFKAMSQDTSAVLLCGGTVPFEEPMTPDVQSTFNLAPLPIEAFITHNPVATSTVLVKRDALFEVGLFDEQFFGPEDYDLWLRLACRYHCVELLLPLSRYRTTSGSLSMDERRFLPQVIAVLQKAFSDGGALAAYRHRQRQAFAEQYSSASWMAYNRGDRQAALRYLLRSWICSLKPLHKELNQDRLLRLKLLLLYLGIKRKSD